MAEFDWTQHVHPTVLPLLAERRTRVWIGEKVKMTLVPLPLTNKSH